MKLYYSSITERKGSWQSSDGYIMSDDKDKLLAKIAEMPKYDEHCSWEYNEVESFETTSEKLEHFSSNAKNGILWIDDYEIEKFQ